MSEQDMYRNIYISNYIFNRNSNNFTVEDILEELHKKNIEIEKYELKELITSLVHTGNIDDNIWDYSISNR